MVVVMRVVRVAWSGCVLGGTSQMEWPAGLVWSVERERCTGHVLFSSAGCFQVVLQTKNDRREAKEALDPDVIVEPEASLNW
jgi:hypothetical protein